MHPCEIMTMSAHMLVVRMTRVIQWMILTITYVYLLAIVYAIIPIVQMLLLITLHICLNFTFINNASVYACPMLFIVYSQV